MVHMSTESHDPYANSPVRFLILPLWLVAIYAMGLLMSEAATVFLWIICAFFYFALLDPIAEFLKKHKWPTAWTALLLVAIATFIFLGLLYLLGYLTTGMIDELQQSKQLFMHAMDSLNNFWNSWSAKWPGFHPAHVAGDVEKVEVIQGSPISGAIGGTWGGTILHGLGSAFTILAFALLVPILTFFLLAERDGLGRGLSRFFQEKGAGSATWKKIVITVRTFFIGNLVLGIVTYPLFVLLFWIFSVPSTFTLAALATVFNLIPFAGSVLSGLFPAVVLYTQTESFGGPFGLYACCVFIHFIIADFVTPKVLGSQVNINATTSTIALVAWGELWGGMGLILAIPLTSLIKILFEHSNFYWLQWIAELMSGDVDQPLKSPSMRTTEKAKKTHL
jgi:predicted PurR-regulated permease PerM